MKKRIIIALVLLAASFFLDEYAAIAAAKISHPALTLFFTVISHSTLAFVLIVPAIMLFRQRQRLPSVYVAVLFSFLCSYFLKFMLRVERPNELHKTISFTKIEDYSFPSSHSTLAFAPLHAMEKAGRARLWLAYGILVAASRIFLGMHKLSDTVAGAVLGYFIGAYFVENAKLDIRKDFFEVRRQLFHLGFGMAIAILMHNGFLNAISLAIALALGIMLSFAYRRMRIPLVSWFIDNFERKKEKIPGKGAITLVAGSLIAAAIFPKDVAAASIAILAMGDSFSHIIGRFFGRTKQPFSVKLLEGTIAGIIAGFFGAVFFVSIEEAIVAASVAMVFESVEIKLHKTLIDDNLVVPVVAGLAILVLRLVT